MKNKIVITTLLLLLVGISFAYFAKDNELDRAHVRYEEYILSKEMAYLKLVDEEPSKAKERIKGFAARRLNYL